ncbi:MAG: vanb3 [Alphaproteobacteria bacterium]|nr:vanb3 [Alphaproteobacteria bacterium]
MTAAATPKAHTPLADPDGSFEVEIASSGRIISVAAGQSVVDALAAVGIEVPVSCEQGICGTCVTMVIAGEPDHRDMFLSAEDRAANDLFTPCCSRARSRRLVIDL